MLLYLVRHGKTDHNDLGLYQGHLPTRLNDEGRAQAGKLAEVLRMVPFTEAWTSDLPRADETARIVLQHHPKLSLHLDPRLRDVSMPLLEGRPWSVETDAGQVESDEALLARLHTWLTNLVASHTPASSPAGTPRTPISPRDPGSGVVLCVTHELCLAGLLRILTGEAGRGGRSGFGAKAAAAGTATGRATGRATATATATATEVAAGPGADAGAGANDTVAGPGAETPPAMNRGSSMGNNLAEAVSDQHHIHDFNNGNAGHQHPLQSPNTDATVSQDDKRIPDAESGSILMIKPSIKSVPSNLHLNTNITPPTATTTTSARLPLPSLSLPPVPSLPSPISPLTSPSPPTSQPPQTPSASGTPAWPSSGYGGKSRPSIRSTPIPSLGLGRPRREGFRQGEGWKCGVKSGISRTPDDGLQDEDEGVQGDV
ncbi:hypothetical protein JCM24511_01442 [Saitozyma sp. JCM 24511]|nr:hypothetical protein JCM24511_01442 [Saitozyma sp. JCM 24511]